MEEINLGPRLMGVIRGDLQKLNVVSALDLIIWRHPHDVRRLWKPELLLVLEVENIIAAEDIP